MLWCAVVEDYKGYMIQDLGHLAERHKRIRARSRIPKIQALRAAGCTFYWPLFTHPSCCSLRPLASCGVGLLTTPFALDKSGWGAVLLLTLIGERLCPLRRTQSGALPITKHNWLDITIGFMCTLHLSKCARHPSVIN